MEDRTLRKDKDGGLKEVAEQTVPDSRSSLPNLGPKETWEETGTAPGDNREPELLAGGRAGAQVACKALVQTLDNQLCLPGSALLTRECATPISSSAPQPWEGEAGRRRTPY